MVKVLFRVAKLLIVGGMLIGVYEEVKNMAKVEAIAEMLERELREKRG